MFKHLNKDIPSSIVVFFVALPLCLGIALASEAPLFSGIIAGIVGGIVVGLISKSPSGVSGPAAGLVVIVVSAINTLGSFEAFLAAVVLGGVIQLILGFLKAGVIGYYFPNSVIKGMLAGIGIIIFLKQIPVAFGYVGESFENFEFIQSSGENTFSAIAHIFDKISPAAIGITLLSLLILFVWENHLKQKGKVFKILPASLIVVLLGVLINILIPNGSTWALQDKQMVHVPVPDGINSFIGQFMFPDFSVLASIDVYIVAITIAIVASLETLLCVEATDKLDPEKKNTPTNRELIAQGTGNIVSGFIGGLPITQVIVRSSANIQAGNKTKMSAVFHGFLLFISIILIPNFLNQIPLSSLAAILLLVGYKLAKPSLFKQMINLGKKQYIPFLVTVLGLVFGDLLIGIGLGLAVGIIRVLIESYKNSHFLHLQDEDGDKKHVKMNFAEEVTFFNKGAIMRELSQIPENSFLEIDVRNTKSLDYDVLEILDDFAKRAKKKNINIHLKYENGEVDNPESYEDLFKNNVIKAG
ncbi:MAG: SulP family inorganic anion transporter [Schleiferiaceae bacterium]|nr:SulP family inorganic anion transporter [Schleiferiaceae bacterium]MDR9442517.1 SulP family inorganic anion transporter [Schleiferiaceae bacterium]